MAFLFYNCSTLIRLSFHTLDDNKSEYHSLQACSVLSNFKYDPYIYNILESPTVAEFVKYKNTSKRFLDYNLESQAEILADYWLLKIIMM